MSDSVRQKIIDFSAGAKLNFEAKLPAKILPGMRGGR